MINKTTKKRIIITANKPEDKTYFVAPGIHMGILTPNLLETIAKVSRKHNIPIVKITSAQRLAFIRMKDEIKEEVWQELGFRLEPSTKLARGKWCQVVGCSPNFTLLFIVITCYIY